MRDEVIRLLLVDDKSTLRRLLARSLDSTDGLEVVGECENGSEVSAKAAEVTPDVVLIDMNMPVVRGPEATKRLLASHPAARVVMLSVSCQPQEVTDAAAAGAAGYVLKDGDTSTLVAAIRAVAAGGTAWPSVPPPTTATTHRPPFSRT